MDKKKADTLFTIVLVVCLIVIVVFKFTLGKPKQADLSFIYDIPTYQAFTADKVSDADIAKIVNAGINAPSGMNNQPWFFAVVTDENVTKQIADEAAQAMAEKGFTPPKNGVKKAQINDAPLNIYVYCEPNALFDAGLALEQMNVAAQSLGYGTKIFGSPAVVLKGDNAAQYKQLLGVPENMEYVSTLSVGKIDAASHKAALDAMSGASPRKSANEVMKQK